MPFAVTDESTQSALDQVADGLIAFNEANSDVGDWHQKVFVVREESRFVGALPSTLTGSSSMSLCFLSTARFRRQGVRRQLLGGYRHYARSRGYRGA